MDLNINNSYKYLEKELHKKSQWFFLEVCMGQIFQARHKLICILLACWKKSPFISCPGPACWKTSLLIYRPGPFDKSFLICWPVLGLGSGQCLCRPLPQPFVRSCAWKVKTIIPLFTAKTFLHIWMIHVNFISFSSTQTY